MPGGMIFVNDATGDLFCGSCGILEEDEEVDRTGAETPGNIRCHFMEVGEEDFNCSRCGTKVFAPKGV